MRYVKRAIAGVIILGATLWAADDLVLLRKIAHDEAYGQVEIHQRYAVQLKNKQVEYRSVRPYMQDCVHSLFPHDDESPCWYLDKYSDRIDAMDSGPWHFWY